MGVALGKEAGLEGEELRSFVKEQQDLAREECFRAREAEKEEREAEREQAQLQKEQLELQAQLQKEQLELQAQLQKEAVEHQAQLQREAGEVREAEREHEPQLVKIKADQGSANQSGQGNTRHTSTGTAKPKLPRFDEKRDDTDTFVKKSETFAESQGWKRDEWAVCLSPLLTGII